jgi:hypothetical protein
VYAARAVKSSDNLLHKKHSRREKGQNSGLTFFIFKKFALAYILFAFALKLFFTSDV